MELFNELDGVEYEATEMPLDGLGHAVTGPVEGCGDAGGKSRQSNRR
jgi:hypothetical protein